MVRRCSKIFSCILDFFSNFASVVIVRSVVRIHYEPMLAFPEDLCVFFICLVHFWVLCLAFFMCSDYYVFGHKYMTVCIPKFYKFMIQINSFFYFTKFGRFILFLCFVVMCFLFYYLYGIILFFAKQSSVDLIFNWWFVFEWFTVIFAFILLLFPPLVYFYLFYLRSCRFFTESRVFDLWVVFRFFMLVCFFLFSIYLIYEVYFFYTISDMDLINKCILLRSSGSVPIANPHHIFFVVEVRVQKLWDKADLMKEILRYIYDQKLGGRKKFFNFFDPKDPFIWDYLLEMCVNYDCPDVLVEQIEIEWNSVRLDRHQMWHNDFNIFEKFCTQFIHYLIGGEKWWETDID